MSLAAAPPQRALASRRYVASATRLRAPLPAPLCRAAPHATARLDVGAQAPQRRTAGFSPRIGGRGSAEAAVNEALRACLTPEAVLALVDCCLSTGKSPDGQPVRFDPANASTALVTLSRVASARQREDGSVSGDSRFEALMRALETQMPRLWASSGANALFALGRLGVLPRQSFVDAFFHASARHFNSYLPGNYAALMSACAALQLQPPAAWMDAYWRGSAKLMGDGVFEARQLAMMVYSAGLMQHTPPADWVAHALAASAERMRSHRPAELAELAAGFGMLGVKPTRSWTEAFGGASGPMLSKMPEPALVATLLAASRLRITPPGVWLQAFWDALHNGVKGASFTPQMCAEVASAAAALRTPMPAQVATAFLARAATGASAMTPAQLADVARAVAVLGFAPPPQWLRALGAALAASPESFVPTHLGAFADALTTAGAWDAPASPAVFQLLVDALAVRAAGGTGWEEHDVAAAAAMYGMYRAAALERPGGLHRPGLGLMAAAGDAWLAQQAVAEGAAAGTEMHAEVAEALSILGVAHVVGERCTQTELAVDFAVQPAAAGTARIALVAAAGAPTQALADGSPGGAAALRDRLLRAAGWRVTPLDAREWEAATAQGEQAQHDLLRFTLVPLGVRFAA